MKINAAAAPQFDPALNLKSRSGARLRRHQLTHYSSDTFTDRQCHRDAELDWSSLLGSRLWLSPKLDQYFERQMSECLRTFQIKCRA